MWYDYVYFGASTNPGLDFEELGRLIYVNPCIAVSLTISLSWCWYPIYDFAYVIAQFRRLVPNIAFVHL